MLYKSKCSNILKLFDLILTLPASSAVCERGFSAMKILKTEYRNRLGSKTMTTLLTVQIHSPEISQFDPVPSIIRWFTPTRRPSVMENTGSILLAQAEADESVVDVEAVDNNNNNVDVAKSGVESDGDVSDYGSEFEYNSLDENDLGSEASDE